MPKKMMINRWLSKLKLFGIIGFVVLGAFSNCTALEGGNWTPIDTGSNVKFSRVAVGNPKTVVALDQQGDVYKLAAGSWKKLAGGKAKAIAAGKDGSIFAISKDTGLLHRREGNRWMQVSGVGKLDNVSVLSKNRIWGTVSTPKGNEVWQLQGAKWARPLAADGKTVLSGWNKVAAAPGGFIATGADGTVFARRGTVPARLTGPRRVSKRKAARKKKASKRKRKRARRRRKRRSRRMRRRKSRARRRTKRRSRRVRRRKAKRGRRKKRRSGRRARRGKRRKSRRGRRRRARRGRRGRRKSKKGKAHRKNLSDVAERIAN